MAHWLLLAANDYEGMFSQLLSLAPDLKPKVTEEIQWAKRVLKKQNRVTWWLRWVRIALIATAIAKGAGAQQQQLQALEQRFEKEVEAKGVYVTLTTLPKLESLKPKLEHFYSLAVPGIQDYDPGFERPFKVIEHFEDAEGEYIERAGGTVSPQSDDKVFIQFGDGWAWWFLPRASCSAEAKAMGHCGNAPAGHRTDRAILSLRQKKMHGKEERWEPHLTFILHTDPPGSDQGILGEMKGKGNAKPVARYHPYIIALLKDHRIKGVEGGGYLPKHNFQFSDLTPEQQAEVRKANPNAYFTFNEYLEKNNIDLEAMAEKIGLSGNTIDVGSNEGDGYIVNAWSSRGLFISECSGYNDGISDVENCVSGHMGFFSEYLLKRIEVSPEVASAIARHINDEFDEELDPESPTIIDDVYEALDSIDDRGDSELRKGLEKAYMKAYGYSNPNLTLKGLLDSEIEYSTENSDGPNTDIYITENGRIFQYVSAREVIELAKGLDPEDEEAEGIEFERPMPHFNTDSDPDSPQAAEDFLAERFGAPASARKREELGQGRLFKRPESDEEARRDGIHVSYLLEPKTAASYEDMFKPLLAAAPKEAPNAKRFIQWAKETLKKQDRITWYLRWARITLALQAQDADPENAQVEQLARKYLNEASQKSGISRMSCERDARNWKHTQEMLAHFYSLGIDAIDKFSPTFESPATVDADFSHLEEQERDKAADDERLIRPDDHDGDYIFLDLGNGWAWWFLDRNSCDVESQAMGHCGNSASKDRDERILSLRQKKRIAGLDYWEPHLTFIMKPDGTLTEMKGRNNDKPVERYHKAIVALLSDKRITSIQGGGYLPSHNFAWDDLSSEDQDKVLEANPDLATDGMAGLYQRKGMIEPVIDWINDQVANITYKKGIGWIAYEWRDTEDLLNDCGDDQVKAFMKDYALPENTDIHEMIDVAFEELRDGDTSLQNITQSIVNEFPGLATHIHQFDTGKVDVVKAMVADLAVRHPDSETLSAILQSGQPNLEVVRESYEKWRDSYGQYSYLYQPEEGVSKPWYDTVDDEQMVEAAQENWYNFGDNIDWPTIKYLPGMFGMNLNETFAEPLPAPKNENQDRLYKEPETDEEAARDGIKVSYLLEPKTALNVSDWARQYMQLSGDRVVDEAQIGDYEFFVLKSGQVEDTYLLGMQRVGSDAFDLNQQAETRSEGVGGGSRREIRQLLDRWLQKYGQLVIGSHNPEKTEKYEQALRAFGYEVKTRDEYGITLPYIEARGGAAKAAVLTPAEAIAMQNAEEWKYMRQTPEEINHGFCYTYAERLAKRLPGATIHWDPETREHAYIEYQGRYYDAETPQGVDSPDDLPHFQRHTTAKTAFISPRDAEITVSIDTGARPKVTVSLDLGIPNFSRFALSVPIDGLDLVEIDLFVRQAFEALLQNVTAFLVSVGYAEDQAAEVLIAAEAAFLEIEGQDASDAGMSDKDLPIRMYETSFELPELFVEQTRDKMVLANVVRRSPDVREIELVPLELAAPENSAEAVIEFYLDQATRTTPRAFSVRVINRPEEQRERGPLPSQWESRLLQPIA